MIHKAVGRRRSLCGEPGRITLLSRKVTCPACLALRPIGRPMRATVSRPVNEEDRRELRASWSRIVRAGWRIATAVTGRRAVQLLLSHSRADGQLDAQLMFAGPDLLSVARAAADEVGR